MTARQITLFLLLFFLSLPVKVVIPQQSDPESAFFEESDPKETKEKDKKKSKKMLELNDVFYISLGINLLNVSLIILLIYFPNYRNLDYIFTFILFNLVIFLLTFALKYVKLSVGAAFGLFAVFSMLRYRTEGLSLKDLTYMFIFIAMGVISAIQLEYFELGVIHTIIFAGTFLLDGNIILKRETMKVIQYEQIDLIKPERYEELKADLIHRTGLNIHRFSIGKINFLRDSASIKVYYYEKKQ
jgi:hypothetical protein